MTDNPQTTAAITQPTGEVAVFSESIADYLKRKDAIHERLTNLGPQETETLKRGETVKLL